MSQEVDYSEFTAVMARLDKAKPAVQAKRRELISRVGSELLAEARGRIGGTGKVQSWQQTFLGSGGGYAAVRPAAKTFYKSQAVGAVTQAIESGHKIRGPSGKAKRYRPQIKVPRKVPGKGMYASSKAKAEALAAQAGAELAEAAARAIDP